jgi:hypothetical protein
MKLSHEVTRQGGWPWPYPPHVTGRYYFSQHAVGDGVNGFAAATDILYATPFCVMKKNTYTAIAIHVTTADLSAPNDARLGIYRNKLNGCEPDALVLDAGTVNVGTTGGKEIAISQELTADWYWLALVTNSSGFSIRGGTDAYNYLGQTAVGVTNHQHYWSVAFTYAALPSTFTGGGALANSTGVPKIMLKI